MCCEDRAEAMGIRRTGGSRSPCSKLRLRCPPTAVWPESLTRLGSSSASTYGENTHCQAGSTRPASRREPQPAPAAHSRNRAWPGQVLASCLAAASKKRGITPPARRKPMPGSSGGALCSAPVSLADTAAAAPWFRARSGGLHGLGLGLKRIKKH